MDSLADWFFGLSENYSVNPWIFGILYVGGIPLFFGVLGWLAKRAKEKKAITVQALLLLYLAIQPYLYVAIFGENLPAWVYGIIVAMVGYGGWSTYSTVRKRQAEALGSTPMDTSTLASSTETNEADA